MRNLLLIIMLSCTLVSFHSFENKATLTLKVDFCNDSYQSFFEKQFNLGIIRLTGSNGKRFYAEQNPADPNSYSASDLPFDTYKISYRNLKRKKVSIAIEINAAVQEEKICIDHQIDWKAPEILPAIEEEEILEIILESKGGTVFYEKLLISKLDGEYVAQYFKVKRDYSVPIDTLLPYYYNLSFKNEKEQKYMTFTEQDWEWLNQLETVLYLVDSERSCRTSEEKYYFVKNGQLISTIKNGFCYYSNPWSKLRKFILNQ